MTMIHDSALGSYQEVITARATDKKIKAKSQDGGVVSALLVYALEENIIDGCLVASHGKEALTTEATVATTKKDILNASGTKYTPCPNLSLLKEATRSYGLEKLAVVGTPCQVMGLRKMQAYPMGMRGVADKVALTISLFCMGSFPYESLKMFVSAKAQINPEKVTKMAISGDKLLIKHSSSGEEFELPVTETFGLGQSGCNYCLDYVGELSDFSCGSVGAEPGWSTIIKRTSNASSLIDEAIEHGVIELNTAGGAKPDLDLIKKLSSDKKKQNQKMIDEKISLGLKAPFKRL